MVSVVIPAYNEEKIISKCLDSLCTQNTRQRFEVIVVNNNSTDQTEKIVKSYGNKLDIKVVFEKYKGRGWARFAGFQTARGDIILSTDADTLVPKDWIEKLSSLLADKDIVAVTGPCRIYDCSPFENTVLNYSNLLGTFLFNIFFRHYWISGYNFAIRKEAYIKSGGFNPKLNAQEDVDLGFRVKNFGKIKYINLPVIFSGRRFRGNLLRGLFSYPKIFIEYYFLKKEEVNLSDVR